MEKILLNRDSQLLHGQLDDKIYQQKEKNIRMMYTQSMETIKVLYRDVIKIENPVHIETVAGNMLNKGLFSNKRRFVCGESRVRDISQVIGADIINGHGVCRHIASFFDTSFQTLGLESHLAGTLILAMKRELLGNDLLEKRQYEQKLDISISHIISMLTKGRNNILNNPNHAITITFYKNKIYILDPTLNCVFRFDQNGDLVLLNNNEGRMRLISLDGTTNIASERWQELLSKETLCYEEYKDLRAEGNRIYQSNISSIEDFYYEIEPLYQNITREMNEIPLGKQRT